LPIVVRQVNKLKFGSFKKLFSVIISTVFLLGFTVIPVSASAMDPGRYNCNTGALNDLLTTGYFTVAFDEVIESDTCTGAVIIPSGVSSIGDRAFSGSGLTTVTIPNSVLSIGSDAFSDSNLTTVTIPNFVTSIGEYAFSLTRDLKTVTIGNSVTNIGVGTFLESGLTTINLNSVTSIGYRAFAITPDLTTVTIPNSVESIDYGAFADSGLTTVTIGNSVLSIGPDAFTRNGALTTVTFLGDAPAADNAFYNASGVIAKVSYNRTGFGVNGSIWNRLLVSMDRGKISCSGGGFFIIENYVVTESTVCEGEVIIPSGVRTIGDFAFVGSAIISVTIPDSVTTIEGYAFYVSSDLVSVTFLGNAPLTVEDDAFSLIAIGAIANVAYNATGFPADRLPWNGLIVRYASAPAGDSGSSSPKTDVTITPAVVKTAAGVFNLKNKTYLSKNDIKTKLSKNRSFKRNPEDLYKYSIFKASKKNCVMRGNYVMALKETGSCDLNVTRTTAKGTKYKYWVKINYSK
jgi:hypothetical protein